MGCFQKDCRIKKVCSNRMNAQYSDFKEGATTVRPPAFAELLVDSMDRYGTQNPSNKANDANALLRREIENQIPANNFDFQKNQAQLQGYFTRIAITDLEIDWRTPNINERNSELLVGVSTTVGSTIYGDIPFYTGFYTGQEIASTIEGEFAVGTWDDELSTINTSISTTWDSATSQLSIYSLNPSTFITFDPLKVVGQSYFNSPVIIPANKTETPAYRFLQTIKAKGDALDWSSGITTQPTNLCYTNYVDIVSNQLTKYARVKDNMTRLENPLQSVVARVYMNAYNTNNPMSQSQATEPHTIAVDYTTPKYIRWNPAEYLNNFDLSLYDEYGDLLYWSDLWSTEYRFTIQASES